MDKNLFEEEKEEEEEDFYDIAFNFIFSFSKKGCPQKHPFILFTNLANIQKSMAQQSLHLTR